MRLLNRLLLQKLYYLKRNEILKIQIQIVFVQDSMSFECNIFIQFSTRYTFETRNNFCILIVFIITYFTFYNDRFLL